MSNDNSQTVEPGVHVKEVERFDYSSLPEPERLIATDGCPPDELKSMTYDQMVFAINQFNAQLDKGTTFVSMEPSSTATDNDDDDHGFTFTSVKPDPLMGTYVYAAPFPEPITPYYIPSFQTHPDPLTFHLQSEVQRLSEELKKSNERNDVLLGLLVDLVKASKR